ncbi:Uncharacterised protein [Tsukamurella paurometabola]|uniref:Uncharacterized protein n=1 Tax=Tsukamurella paurometabola TaxID=2061 RepID=A0A3P8LDF9_TSUPA|nr:Uncharacterised protein [Tsukamurella paurometabola]
MGNHSCIASLKSSAGSMKNCASVTARIDELYCFCAGPPLPRNADHAPAYAPRWSERVVSTSASPTFCESAIVPWSRTYSHCAGSPVE